MGGRPGACRPRRVWRRPRRPEADAAGVDGRCRSVVAGVWPADREAPRRRAHRKALAEGAYAIVANLTADTATVGGNQFGAMYSASNTPLTDVAMASDLTALVLELNPCSFLMPHTTPLAMSSPSPARATRPATLSPENYLGPPINSTLPPGSEAVYPQGTTHSQVNFGCDTLRINAYFPTASPGKQPNPPLQWPCCMPPGLGCLHAHHVPLQL